MRPDVTSVSGILNIRCRIEDSYLICTKVVNQFANRSILVNV